VPWAFHDAAFAAKDSSFDDTAIEQFAADAKLDLPQFNHDREAACVKEKVQADVALGHVLGVRGTPSGFLGGRRAASLTGESLEILIEHDLHPRR
jgi:protein-disulfide isomerase